MLRGRSEGTAWVAFSGFVERNAAPMAEYIPKDACQQVCARHPVGEMSGWGPSRKEWRTASEPNAEWDLGPRRCGKAPYA
ncbi:MAG: hypothetical protein NZM31_00785 [Gemmatales bacterium]|nr:hypothetical protein [Gemmatales bacterium]MDW8385529.1 hypothetical protein [Gemmatales bacterium]